MLVFISVDPFFAMVDLFIHSCIRLINFLSMFICVLLVIIFFCADNLNEPSELLVKNSVALHIRFGGISMEIFPLEKSPVSSGSCFSLFYLRALYSQLGDSALSHTAVAGAVCKQA